jgi:PIN domain
VRTTDFPVILDACVLLPMPLADTLFRMAESPRLYLPKWSDDIIAEVSRNLLGKWGKTPEQVQRRENALREHFPEAWVEGYAPLISVMTNKEEDRHVVAAAVSSGAKLIVTYNAKHFPESSLKLWGIERQGPSTFLRHLYDLEPGIVAQKLTQQASNLGIEIEDLLV